MPPQPLSATLPPRLVRLRDGRDYRLRMLGAGDEAAVVTFFATVSTETIRARYGYLIHDMTPERATRLVATDLSRELALGIFGLRADGTEDRLWAMGRLVHAPDNCSAECAFLVHDAKRQIGIASCLLRYLRVAGRRRGLPRLFAQVRRENKGMLNTFIRNGAQLHFSAESDVVEVDILLRPHPKILFDNPPPQPSIAPMSSPEKKGFSPITLVIDLVLVAAFFSFFYYTLQPHVPSNDPTMVRLWATLAAACMSGVFWLALQMLKRVYVFQRANRK